MELPRTLEDIQKKFINAQVQESLHLDYKRSKSISNTTRAEIAKDVSAFANSDGGMIIYGVEEGINEQEHLPIGIDDGIEHKKFSREWLENVITSNITPRLEDIEISQIPINEAYSIFAVKVSKSFRGPHQERLESKRYYRRFNFKSVPMEDYEVREALNRRRTVPTLVDVDVKIKNGFVIFVVSNPGNTSANDLRFQFPQGMMWQKQLGIPKILKESIKFFPARRTFNFYYNNYLALTEAPKEATNFEISVSYLHPEVEQRIYETFHFDLLEFKEAVDSKSDIEVLTRELTKVLKDLLKETKKIERRLDVLSGIASATGLDLSVSTTENLRHIKNKDGEIEKLDPRGFSSEIFVETLNVPREVAWEISKYFDGYGEVESFTQIAGVTEEALERFKRFFTWPKVQKRLSPNLSNIYIEAPKNED